MAMLSGTLIIDGAPLLHFALHRSVDQEILQHLVSRSTMDDINTYTPAGDLSVTAIHLAIQTGSRAIVESLLQKGGDALRPVVHLGLGCSLSTLMFCCGNQSSTNRILQQILDAHAKNLIPIPTLALAAAVLNNNFSAAAMLIRAGVDINGVDDTGLTPLGIVIKQCTTDTVSRIRFLLEYPPSAGKVAAEFMVKPGLSGTVFHILAAIPSCTPCYDRRTLLNVTDYLLRKFNSPAEINAQTKKRGCTALHFAAEDNPIVTRKLLEREDIDIALKTVRSRKTARQYSDESLVRSVPNAVAQYGERAINRYKRDQMEVRNLFAGKCGEKHINWRSATKTGEVAVEGGKVRNLMFISMGEE